MEVPSRADDFIPAGLASLGLKAGLLLDAAEALESAIGRRKVDAPLPLAEPMEA